jgi:hypothetical protein
MSDYQQRVSGAFSERKRLMRLRRRKENLHFWEEFQIIPKWLKVLVLILYVAAVPIAIVGNLSQGPEMFPQELRGNPGMASLAIAGIVTLVSLCLATFLFMVAYVNRDAKRRGMSSALWTLLVLILSPGWLIIGFITYFLMREPLPYPCPQCGNSVGARYNFCPNCKCNLHPSCPQCKQEVAELDKFCPNCGADLKAGGSPELPAPSPAPSL